MGERKAPTPVPTDQVKPDPPPAPPRPYRVSNAERAGYLQAAERRLEGLDGFSIPTHGCVHVIPGAGAYIECQIWVPIEDAAPTRKANGHDSD